MKPITANQLGTVAAQAGHDAPWPSGVRTMVMSARTPVSPTVLST